MTAAVRARTENVGRISRRRLELLALEAPPIDVERPRTRGECASLPRPCPWVGCRYSLYLEVDVRRGSIKYRFPELEPGEMPAARSCVLDVADRGGTIQREVGEAMNISRERVRQIEAEGLRKVVAGIALAAPSDKREGEPMDPRRTEP